MAPTSYFAKGNHLLKSLSASDLDPLEPHLVHTPLTLRQDLEKPQKPIDDVYFMVRGIASVVAIQPRGIQVEIGIVGCEGMTGCAVVLGKPNTA
jgi:hypothetical protein